MADLTRLRHLLTRFAHAHIVVAGDLVADEFVYTRIDRVSREAPVLILTHDRAEILAGGAGNAAANVAALGGQVEIVGVVGRDDVGTRLLEALPERAGTKAIVRARSYTTPIKTRILAGGIHSAKQQVVRVDRAGGPVSPLIGRQVEEALVRAVGHADAVIISDYGCGLITPALWSRVLASARPKKAPLVLVDSRYALASYHGMTACTPNESEVEALLGVRINDDRNVLERAGRELLERLSCQAVLITRGSRGMALFEPDRATDHIAIVGSDEVADVTGAGDTVIATFALALASGATFGDAARLANYAGGIVVMKRGTATATRVELATALR